MGEMAEVSITVNDRVYQIACDDGEEDHIAYLAQYINHHVDNLVERVGQVGEARLLLMAALVLADELSDVYTELDESKGGETVPTGDGGLQLEAMETLAARLETIAASLESN